MRIFDKKRCDEIISNIRGKDGIVADVEKANKSLFLLNYMI